jgi:hypothetical protein
MGVLTIALSSCNSPKSDSEKTTYNFDQGKEKWNAWYDLTYPTNRCESVVDTNFGLPAPSLLLMNTPGKCSGADILNEMVFTDGTVELDVYLETDALVDVVFRGDLEKNTGYIARLDSRNYHDTFIKIDTWTMLGENSGHITSPHQWHHMRVEVESSSFTLLCDDQVVARTIDTEFSSGQIALMNEVNKVHVDNVTVLSRNNTQTTGDNPVFKKAVNNLTTASLLVFGMCFGCLILLIGIYIGFSIRQR